MYKVVQRRSYQALGMPQSTAVAGQRAMLAPRHVPHAKTGPHFVEPDRIKRTAVPVEHRLALVVCRTEDRLQKIPEVVRIADILQRTTPRPVHEGNREFGADLYLQSLPSGNYLVCAKVVKVVDEHLLRIEYIREPKSKTFRIFKNGVPATRHHPVGIRPICQGRH